MELFGEFPPIDGGMSAYGALSTTKTNGTRE
jgi:hypothetical protein